MGESEKGTTRPPRACAAAGKGDINTLKTVHIKWDGSIDGGQSISNSNREETRKSRYACSHLIAQRRKVTTHFSMSKQGDEVRARFLAVDTETDSQEEHLTPSSKRPEIKP